MRTWRSPRPLEGDSRACVACGVVIRAGHWCNDCREEELSTLRVRLPAHSRSVLLMRLGDDVGECECGREKPRRAPRCSHCAWMERQ
jgi:hypothetical protein